VLAYKSTRKGLQRLKADPAAMASDLDNSWQVLTEPVQTVMRKHGFDNAYELLK
jgi:adenylosuccinate lyase